MANKLFSTGGSNDGESGFMIWSFRDFRQVARNDRESGLLTFLKFVFLVGCLFVNSSYVRKSFSPLGKEENTLRSGQVCFCVLFLLLTHGWGRTIHSLCFYVTVFEKSLNSFFFFDRLYLPQMVTMVSPIQQVLITIRLWHPLVEKQGLCSALLNLSRFCTMVLHYMTSKARSQKVMQFVFMRRAHHPAVRKPKPFM